MLYFLKGITAALEPGLAVIECAGVGYACKTTSFTLSGLQPGQPATLYTHLSVREDGIELYGFGTKEEKRLFLQLTSVSGVGPKAALSILSTTTPSQLALAILTEDVKTLTLAPGIGKKIAQRIVLELRDKLAKEQPEMDWTPVNLPAAGEPVQGDKLSEAGAALAVLGYSPAEVQMALKGVDAEKMTVEELIKAGLRNMMQ